MLTVLLRPLFSLLTNHSFNTEKESVLWDALFFYNRYSSYRYYSFYNYYNRYPLIRRYFRLLLVRSAKEEGR